LVCFMFVVSVTLRLRERSDASRRLLEENHKKSILEAAKEAHERTIAYACHQLR
jgi:hypothetical protein